MGKILNNILTFGASGRVDEKVEEFERYKAEMSKLNQIMEERRKVLNTKFEELIQVKTFALINLKKIEIISKNIRGKDRDILIRDVGHEIEKVDFSRIEKTISIGEVALNSAKGVSTGVTTALGAWALVGQVGAASTGTAISTLSGVAATNATLAWFGGGAAAAAVGGGGVAVGTAVLGGIIAIPALVIAGIFNHVSANKKIKEIGEKELDVIKVIDEIKNNLFKFDLLEERTDELILSINKAKDVFEIELKKVYRKIYPLFFISKLYKAMRKNLIRRNYFSENDLIQISYIGGLAGDFATLIDTKVFE